MIQFKTEEAQAILDYLKRQPWEDANPLINMIWKAVERNKKGDPQDGDERVDDATGRGEPDSPGSA